MFPKNSIGLLILGPVVDEDGLALLVPHNHGDDPVLETPIVELADLLEKPRCHARKGFLPAFWHELYEKGTSSKKTKGKSFLVLL